MGTYCTLDIVHRDETGLHSRFRRRRLHLKMHQTASINNRPALSSQAGTCAPVWGPLSTNMDLVTEGTFCVRNDVSVVVTSKQRHVSIAAAL